MICLTHSQLLIGFGLLVIAYNFVLWDIVHSFSFSMSDRQLRFWNILHPALIVVGVGMIAVGIVRR
jgi:hypothetical protein